MKLFLIIIFSGAVFAQEQYIQIVFSEKMDKTTLFDKNNYTIFDDNLTPIPINKIGVTDSIVVLVTPFLKYKTNFIVRVQNVKDVAGNLIDPHHNSVWFFFDGFDPQQTKPKLIFIK